MPARLTFTVEARDAGQPVPFDAFAEMTAHVASLLAQLDIARSGELSTRWVVRNLAAGSAFVEIEAVPLNPLFDTSEHVTRDLTAGLSLVVSEHRRPEAFSDIAWADTQAIAAILHDGIGHLLIAAGPTTVDLTPDVLAPDTGRALQLPEVEVGEQDAISSIEGSLETVNGHDPRQMYFAVWDVLYHRRIRCDFPPLLLDEVRQGLLERVRVHGLVRFDRFGHPTRIIEVRAIQLLSHGEAHPLPADLRGLVPEMTGGLGADEWVRRIRDA